MAEAAAVFPPPRYRWVVLAAGMVAVASIAGVFAGLVVLAPALQERYALTLSQTGLIVGAHSIGSLTTMLLFGLLADRLGERVISFLGPAGAALALTGAAFAPSFPWLIVLLALAGASGAAVQAATGRAVMAWFGPRERGLALGIRQAAIPIGAIAQSLTVPHIASAAGLRGALLALAAAPAAGGLCALVFLREGFPDESEGDDRAGLRRHPLRDPTIWRVSVTSCVVAVTQFSLLGFLVLFLHDTRGFSPGKAGAVLAAVYAAGTIGRLVAGVVSDRLGTRVLVIRWILAATAATVALSVGLMQASAWLLVPAIVVGGGLAMSWNGVMLTAAAERAGRARSGAALGLQQTALAVSAAVTPLVFAPAVEATSWETGFAAAATAPLVGLLLLRSWTGRT